MTKDFPLDDDDFEELLEMGSDPYQATGISEMADPKAAAASALASLPPAPSDAAVGGMAYVGDPEPIPPRTPEHFVCMRGPCRYYWHMTTLANVANVGGSFRQHHHTCLRGGGGEEETELVDNNVFDCNQWDPADGSELYAREQRRAEFFKKNPHCKPPEKR